MKRRILTLALALILVFSVVAVPVQAATGKEVHAYLKSIAMLSGNFDDTEQCDYTGFQIGSSEYGNYYFFVQYMRNTQYVHTSIAFYSSQYLNWEVTWKISSNPTPAYNAFVEVYDKNSSADDTRGTIVLPADYSGGSVSFKYFSGNTGYKDYMLSVITNFLPGVLEFTRLVINDNDYSLRDLGMTGYTKCDWVHAYDHGVDSEPTCVDPGVRTYTCRVCGATTVEELQPALGHDLISHEAQEPSCTEIGWAAYETCSRCGYSTYEETPALGHAWDEGTEVQAPGCVTEGTVKYSCSRCGETKEETVPALGHAWDEGTEVQTLGCVTDGVVAYSCTRCGETREEITPALGHLWTFTEVLTEGEEGNLHAGTGLYTCTRCGETEEDELCAAKVFTDMPAEGNWAHDPIDWAYFNGITSGKTPTTFATKDVVTRAEAMTFLWKTVGSPDPITEENPFTDVPAGKYYYKPVMWAVENGVTGGATPTTFAPKQKCTRAQIVMFLWAAAGKPEPETTENPFTDVTENKYYYKAVLWAMENGITGGIAADKFGPNNTCTRAQIVTFLYKAEPLLISGIEPTDPEPDPYSWYVIGNFYGNNWDVDYPMTETEENVYESEILELHAGDELKVRMDHSWDTNFGADGWNGSNYIVTEDGNYIVRLDLNIEVLSLIAQ